MGVPSKQRVCGERSSTTTLYLTCHAVSDGRTTMMSIFSSKIAKVSL